MEPVVGVLAVLCLAFAGPFMLHLLVRLLDSADGVAGIRPRRASRRGDARPFEEIADDLRRLGRRFHTHHVSHIKAESLRRSYDAVLIEACAALDVEHLLAVLPPGAELDTERRRVELALHRWGLDLSDLGEAA